MSSHTAGKMIARGLVLLTVLAGSAGCFKLNRGAPVQQHYVLGEGSTLEITTPTGERDGLAIGLRRPQVAAYLDAPFIVVRRGSNQIGFSELHRWGEHLGGGINRALAGYLAQQGAFRVVSVAPWAASESHDFLIQLNVLRFEGLAPEEQEGDEEGQAVAGEAHLSATWEIIRTADGVVVMRGATEHRKSGWRVGDYAGLVTLLDEGLRVLAEELAAGVAGVPVASP